MYLWYFILSVLLAGQPDKKDNALTTPYKLPKVLDTLPATDSFLTTGRMLHARSVLYYGGNLTTDTLQISNDLFFKFYSPFWDIEINDSFNSNDFIGQPFKIVVDTSQILVASHTEYRWVPFEESDDLQINEPFNVYYNSYPVFIINHTDTINLLSLEDGDVTIIQEARNPKGEWKPIEYWMFSFCGNSYHYCILPANSFALIKTPIYKGEFKTEIRLKMLDDEKIYYSNSFNGSVNLSQFDTTGITAPRFLDKN